MFLGNEMFLSVLFLYHYNISTPTKLRKTRVDTDVWNDHLKDKLLEDSLKYINALSSPAWQTKMNSLECNIRGFPGGSVVKTLPVKQKTWVWFLGLEDDLEKEMATHSSILAWRIPWQRSLMGYSPWGHKRVKSLTRLTGLNNNSNIIYSFRH